MNTLPLVVNLPAMRKEKSPKAALTKVTTPNDTRKVCAAMSFESIENETAGSHCGDNDADGYTRVTRKQSVRTKAVIGTNNDAIYHSTGEQTSQSPMAICFSFRPALLADGHQIWK